MSRLFYQGILKEKYHCTIDLLFDWFGLVCFANKNKNCHTKVIQLIPNQSNRRSNVQKYFRVAPVSYCFDSLANSGGKDGRTREY
jgi:hypothetical protein